MRNDTTTSNCRLDQSIQFLVTSNGELQVTRCDTFDFEIFTSVSGQLQNLSGEVFQNSRSVYSSGCSHPMALVYRILQETMDAAYGELKSSL